MIFFLISQLALGRPVMYTKALRTTYYFNADGIWRAKLSDLQTHDIPDVPEAPIWSLIDSDRSEKEPPDEITGTAFPVHAISPDESRYRRWRKQLLPHRLFMNPWTTEDLLGW